MGIICALESSLKLVSCPSNFLRYRRTSRHVASFNIALSSYEDHRNRCQEHCLILCVKLGRLTEYQVIGRHLPTEANPTPKLYRMRIFAPNTVVAKSRFWFFLMKLRKVKKANGEIVSINVVCTPFWEIVCACGNFVPVERSPDKLTQILHLPL